MPVLYFATASGPLAREAMAAGIIGQIVTPASNNLVEPGAAWCADNAAFAGKYPGDDAYLRWLAARDDHRPRCRFAPAPDVVGNAAATWGRSAPLLPMIRDLGYPAALVGQNGMEDSPVPWDAFDVLFLGGDDAWKLGPDAARLAGEAKARGKSVHMGRVNSLRRCRYARSIGCDSVDGTYLAFGPDLNLPKVRRWAYEMRYQPTLFGD